MSITIGIDISLVATGVVVLKDNNIVKQELIKSSPSGKLPKNEIARLLGIEYKITDIINKAKPKLVIIEGLAFLAKGTSLVQLAGLNYFIRKYLWECSIPFAIVAPTSLKKFVTGSGNAKKDSIMLEIYKRYGESFDNDNLADAFALAKVGQELLSKKKLPKFQEEVINLLKIQL